MYESMFKDLANKAKATANITADDYIGEDNLYYCGKCHTRKQTIVNVFNSVRTVPCVCECQVARAKAEEEAEHQPRQD